jgi:hypothetical protein
MKPMQNDSIQGVSAKFEQRRAFIRNAGAALSATVAASTAVAASESTSHQGTQPGAEENEIRQLHLNFVDRLNGRRYEELPELFVTADAQRCPDVSHFQRRLPEGAEPPVHDYFVGHSQHLDTIEVTPDRRSATARFHCLTRMESALMPTLPLIEMARQQGQGVIQWWESGVLESTCVSSETGWKISRLSFQSSGPWSDDLQIAPGPRQR